MNDFTKDEINKLLWAINYVKENTTNRSDAMSLLREKIKSMVDNYCDHEYLVFLQDQNNEPLINKCINCHDLRFSHE